MLSKANQKKMMKLLNHQLVFYVVLFLTIVSVVGQLVINNYVYVGSFLVLGALTYCFTKKPVVVLLVPLVLVNLLLSGNMVREGMKNNKNKKNKKNTKETTDEEENTDNEGETTDEEDKKNTDNEGETTGEVVEDEVKRIFGKKPKELFKGRVGFQPKKRLNQRGKPAYINPEEDKDESVGSDIDYATTLQQAYKNIQGAMGKDGMKGLTKETSKLVNQQKDLMNSLKDMTPIIDNAKKSLHGFKMPDLSEMKNIMKSFRGGSK